MDLFSATNDRFSANTPLPPQIAQSKLHKTFQFERIITEDSSGLLFAAGRTVKGKRVAVAVLAPGFSVVSKRLMAVDHPNINKTHQIIKQVDDTEAVVMDLPEGNPLPLLFAHGMIFSVNQAVTLVLQMLSAFHAVHKRKESLRTVGGNNLFIEEEPQGRLRLKLVNCGVGTSGLDLKDPNYLSPEQVMDASSATLRSDIWTAGAIFYHLLFGRPLYQGRSGLEVAQKIMLEDPVIEAPEGAVPTEVVDVLRRALQRNENQRFRDVPEMVGALLPLRTQHAGDPLESASPQLFNPPPLPISASPSDQSVEEDWAEAPTVPPDDPIAAMPETEGAFTSAPKKVQSAPAFEMTIIAPLETPPKPSAAEATQAEIPSAKEAESFPSPPDLSASTAKPSEDKTDNQATESETLVAADRVKQTVMEQTKIDDLAVALRRSVNAIDSNAAPPPKGNAAPASQKPSEKRFLKTIREALLEQPALIVALGVFSMISIAFTVLLASMLRNPDSPKNQFQQGDIPSVPNEANPPSGTLSDTKNHTKHPKEDASKAQVVPNSSNSSEMVTIDLLRVPAEAKVMVDGLVVKTPLKLSKSKTAVKLTIKAKGFKLFERLVVPDRNRKMVVEMEVQTRSRRSRTRHETE
jgi:serine/threonine protein kinase